MIAYIVVITSFVNKQVDNITCRNIMIDVRDSMQLSFVTKNEIFNIIHNDKHNILGESLTERKLFEIEQRVSSIDELGSAEVYITVDGILHVEVDQRDPIVRIISSFGNSYFIDNYGFVIQHNYKYTPRIIVITGNVEMPDESIASGDINSLPEDSKIKKLFSLASFINNDEFWKGQIEQVWVGDNDDVQLIPRIGQHIINFGPVENVDQKFDYLRTFYMEVIPVAGWNKYREINLRYDGQIVCKKR